MARIILHSDDFGLHPAVNEAIFEAAGKGVLSSASVMVNGLAAEDALREAEKYPNLGVGLHLNIVRGRPLSDPVEIPSLVGPEGCFLNSAAKLLMRAATGGINVNEVYSEYRRQILFMTSRGIQPTHIDSEKHSHLFLPQAAMAASRIARDFDVRKIRYINESPLLRILRQNDVTLKGSILQNLKLSFLEYREKSHHCWKGLSWPLYTLGVGMSRNTTFSTAFPVLRALLEMDGDFVIEWMFHLGFHEEFFSMPFKQEFGNFFQDDSRKQEQEFLLSNKVKALLEDHPGKLITYREL